jgi:hypothetical protein
MTVRYHLGDRTIHIIYPADYVQYPYEGDEYYEVIPETVCRLLRHTDADGHCELDRVFQNDIVAIWDRREDFAKSVPMGIALIIDEHSVNENGLGRWFPSNCFRAEIIGNAYDNPELLKGHSLNHFVNNLNEYPGDDYSERHQYLSEKYGIHGAHACCYMCNFENDYICHKFNGGCKEIDTCRKIREAGD